MNLIIHIGLKIKNLNLELYPLLYSTFLFGSRRKDGPKLRAYETTLQAHQSLFFTIKDEVKEDLESKDRSRK